MPNSDTARTHAASNILGPDVIVALGIVATMLVAAAVTFVGDLRETAASQAQGTVLQQEIGALGRGMASEQSGS